MRFTLLAFSFLLRSAWFEGLRADFGERSMISWRVSPRALQRPW